MSVDQSILVVHVDCAMLLAPISDQTGWANELSIHLSRFGRSLDSNSGGAGTLGEPNQ